MSVNVDKLTFIEISGTKRQKIDCTHLFESKSFEKKFNHLELFIIALLKRT